MKKEHILGISSYYHDSAAAILCNGEILAASQEERFTRKKGDSDFPDHAVDFCLDEAGITEDEVDYLVFYENPYTKFERLLSTYHTVSPRGLKSYLKALPSWLTEKLWVENQIANELGVKKRVYFCDHHLSHAASAFYPSPFENSAILTIDGVGEWSTTTYGIGQGNQITLSDEIRFPNSMGLLYSAVTYFCGFKINSGEYKLMGLAPYGEPKYYDLICKHLAQIMPDGSLLLNQAYFSYTTGLVMTNHEFSELFGGPPREPESLITQREMDLAASVQKVVDEVVLRSARHVRKQTGMKTLCLAGGVALNVVSIGKLSSAKIFDKVWTQPAAGDAGGALGCALWFWHQHLQNPRVPRKPDGMQGAFTGYLIKLESREDDEVLRRMNAVWETCTCSDLQDRIANSIAEGKVVAVARGRAEFGPRALGGRSILGDARAPEMQKHMNLKIKFRESFRPFAPMVLQEKAAEYFEVEQESPYMLLVYQVRDEHRLNQDDADLWGIDKLNVVRSTIPAVTHVDYSARVQTVDAERNPFIHGVLTKFEKNTGCPVIINTSFNVRGEPIVNTAEDAYRCFMATEIDCLVIGNRWFEREKQKNSPLNEDDREKWLKRFDLD